MEPQTHPIAPPPEAREPPPGAVALTVPAVALSAAAECLAGAFVGGASPAHVPPYALAAASALLFAAGPVFAYHYDRAPRERLAAPPPPGPGAAHAWRLGWSLLLGGLLLGVAGGRDAAALALGVALLVVLHAAATRGVWGLGFATVAAARGLNLLLGATAGAIGVPRLAPLALPIALYALGWEALRAARQPGAPRSTAFVALVHLVAGVALALYQATSAVFAWGVALPLLALLLLLVFPRFVRAVILAGVSPVAEAAQFGLAGLLLLEAMLAAGYAGPLPGALVVALLLPLERLLRRYPVPLSLEPR